MTDIKDQALDILLKNRRVTNGHQYTVPSPKSYPYQWLWDSAFHAIILSHFNTADAKKELLSLVSKQFESGMIPHMIYWVKGEHLSRDWGREDTSTITQPPILALAVWHIYEKDQDKSFLEQIYPHLMSYTKYLLTHRDPRSNHLIGIINPDESGEDDSPRFDLPLGLNPIHTDEENFQSRLKLIEKNKECKFDTATCMRNFFWVKDVPFNSIMVNNLLTLSKIAELLGKNEDKEFIANNAQDMKKAMREKMFEDGVFYSTYNENYKKIKVNTWAIFAPLIANLYTKEEAKRLVSEHLNNSNEFALNYQVPTVPKNEAVFNPDGFWRGPVWIATNWFVYRGLINYGFTKEADQIRDSSIALIKKSGFREHFNPDTGEGQGAHNFTWGGLVVDMLDH